MLNKSDYENAFGKADASFEQNLYTTLDKLQKGEPVKTGRKRIVMRAVLGIAAVMLLTSAVFAAANASKIVEYFTGPDAHELTRIPEEAAVLVQQPVSEPVPDDTELFLSESVFNENLDRLEHFPDSPEKEQTRLQIEHELEQSQKDEPISTPTPAPTPEPTEVPAVIPTETAPVEILASETPSLSTDDDEVLSPEEIYQTLTISISEVMFDGNGLVTMLEIKSSDPRYFLTNWSLDSDITYRGTRFQGKTGMTIKEYLKTYEPDKIPVCVTAGCQIDNTLSAASMPSRMNEDGSITYITATVKDGDPQKSVSAAWYGSVGLFADDQFINFDTNYEFQIPFTATAPEPKYFLQCNEPQEYERDGVRIERVTLSNTSMGSYVMVYLTITDKEKQNDPILKIVGDSGQQLSIGGPIGVWQQYPVDYGITSGEKTQFIQCMTMIPMDIQPKSLTISFIRGSGEEHVFEMK